ncbi:MAG: site-2 protease family protein [Anaerolineaceae bacterium]
MLDLSPSVLISRILTLIIAFTLHEFAHGRVADMFGDDTPRLAGRLTLNPLKHLDPIGTLMLILVGFGWAKPVPINPDIIRRRSRAGVMLVSLAGPFTNLLLALAASVPFQLNLVSPYSTATGILPTMDEFLLEFVFINVALFLFNLLPLAPLDGEKVVEYLLPDSFQPTFNKIRQFGPFLLLALVFIGPQIGFDLFGIIFQQPLLNITRFLVGL